MTATVQPSPDRSGIGPRWMLALPRALWFTIVPTALAVVAVRFLVPRALPGSGGFAAAAGELGQRYPILLGVALFFFFAFLARYWRFYLPGGRLASGLSASLVATKPRESLREYAAAARLHEALSAPSMRRRLSRFLSAEQDTAIDRELQELWEAMAASDEPRVLRARQSLEARAAPALAHRERMEGAGVALAVVLAAGAAVALRAWVADSYSVLSGSMLPTLAPGDRVAGTKFAYRSPERGDIIVFASTADSPQTAPQPDRLIKRVIGLPGDRIEMAGGVPIINGWRVPTCNAGDYLYVAPNEDGTAVRAPLFVEFLDGRAYLTLQAPGTPQFSGAYRVKPGEVFVLGDNRSQSADSRVWNGGAGGGVPLASVVAQANSFLSGAHLDGQVDLGRLLRPLRGLATRVHVEGIDPRPLEEGVERCLRKQPTDTSPPGAAQ